MIASVELHIKYANKIQEMYLFERLRYIGMNNAGYFNRCTLSHHEKYKVLPNLRKRGWVKGNRVIKYRKILNREVNTMYVYPLPKEALKSLNTFKGYILGMTESYGLNFNYKLQNGKTKELNYRDKNFEPKRIKTRSWDGEDNPYRIKKFKGTNNFQGRFANSILSSYLRVSEKTISRWRKDSPNKYIKRNIIHKNPDSVRRDGAAYLSKKFKRFIEVDLLIKTKIPIFTYPYLRNTV